MDVNCTAAHDYSIPRLPVKKFRGRAAALYCNFVLFLVFP